MVNPFRKSRRLVRLNLQSGVRLERDGSAEELPGVTLEGIDFGKRGGHYILYAPKVIEDPGTGADPVPVPINGHVEVPASRVLFKQVIG